MYEKEKKSSLGFKNILKIWGHMKLIKIGQLLTLQRVMKRVHNQIFLFALLYLHSHIITYTYGAYLNMLLLHVFYQIVCPKWFIVAPIAFVWPFSTMRFQMLSQIACLSRCKVALVALVCLFSTVCFQMSPQIAWLEESRVTQATFVQLFSDVRIHMSHSYVSSYGLSPLCVFKCCLKFLVWANAKLHWLHLFVFSPLCVLKCFLKSPASKDA